MSTPNNYDNQIDAVIAAQHAARTNGYGYAFAVEWRDHWSVETRKPLLRDPAHKVLECREGDGQVYLA